MSPKLVFDVTMLLRLSARRPSGIQRVQLRGRVHAGSTALGRRRVLRLRSRSTGLRTRGRVQGSRGRNADAWAPASRHSTEAPTRAPRPGRTGRRPRAGDLARRARPPSTLRVSCPEGGRRGTRSRRCIEARPPARRNRVLQPDVVTRDHVLLRRCRLDRRRPRVSRRAQAADRFPNRARCVRPHAGRDAAVPPRRPRA